MKKFLVVACAAGAFTSLCACTSLEPLRPDMEARPLPSRADEIAYINELRKAYQIDYAGEVPCYTGEKLKSFRPKYVQGYPEWDAAQDAGASSGQCLRFAANPGDERIASYLENGFGLTDLYCQRYFIVATEARQTRKLQRGLFKTGNTLINAVMTALSAGADPISISSATFSAIDSGYGAIDDAFVVAPSREDVRKLVQSAQQKFRSDIFAKDKDGASQVPKSYASARAAIERYAGLCTFDGMRQLVADAVTDKTDALNVSAQKKPAQDAKKPDTDIPEIAGKPKVEGASPAIDPQSLTTPVPISPK